MIINRCSICLRPISHKNKLCKDCEEKFFGAFFENYMKRCPKCSYPLLDEHYICPRCKNENQAERIYSAVDYADVFSRKVLENYKFHGQKNLSKLIALIYIKCFENLKLKKDEIILTTVPSSIKSLERRGFDQMKVIGQVLSKKHGYNYIDMFENTDLSGKQQKELNREERLKATNRFAVKPNISIDTSKTIVVLDDVTTTGATLKGVLDLLSKAGYPNNMAVTWFIEF